MSSENSVLVIAFDGMDYELMQEFGCDTLTGMEEFGRIDNDTGISSRVTSELFTSFITGELPNDHGVKGVKKWSDQKIGRLIESLPHQPLVDRNWPGATRFQNALKHLLDVEKVAYNHSDYPQETLFDRIENSKSLNVPGYNPSPYWSKFSVQNKLAVHDVDPTPAWKQWDRYEYRRRRHQLFRRVNTYLDFLMAQFHRVDTHQHWYGTSELEDHYDEERMRKLYGEIDALAGDIIEFFESEFDTIIFMSDHGVPEGDDHNKQAFYSCNKSLFGNSVPHITDFHDKILMLESGQEVRDYPDGYKRVARSEEDLPPREVFADK